MAPNARSIGLVCVSAMAGAVLALALPALADEMVEEEIRWRDLPEAVAITAKAELAEREPEEVERISYEGIVVLYEVEYYEGGKEHEVYVYPDGTLAARHAHAADED